MKKSRRQIYGQHFLTNPQITDRIVSIAGVTQDDTVLEVGPGRGILTDSLLKTGCKVVAVEKDKKLFGELSEKYADQEKLQLFNEDILKFPLPRHPRALVVANLPYSVSTEIIFKLIDNRNLFSELYLMVQKEVAERLVATPGGKDYGVLSVLTQLYSDSEIVMKLAPGAFTPPPKVDSAVVAMKLSDEPRVAVSDVEAFKKLVRQAFATRRKMLRNCLNIKDDEKWQSICSEIGIDPKARAENLSLEQFAGLILSLPDDVLH